MCLLDLDRRPLRGGPVECLYDFHQFQLVTALVNGVTNPAFLDNIVEGPDGLLDRNYSSITSPHYDDGSKRVLTTWIRSVGEEDVYVLELQTLQRLFGTLNDAGHT